VRASIDKTYLTQTVPGCISRWGTRN